LLSTDLLLRALGSPQFSWGAVSGTGETVRRHYLAALRAADGHDFSLLAAFVRS
jgi:hypothetical protein